MNDETMHKLVIECPVAKRPDIFEKIDRSMDALDTRLTNQEERSIETKAVADSAKKRVDFIYWLGIPVGSTLSIILMILGIIKYFGG